VATIPSIPTESPGNFWTSALWNTVILGGLSYLLAPVRFKGYSSTTQSIATGTAPVPLTLDTEIVDSDGGHSTSTNTSRYTAQTAGLYYVTGAVTFATNATNTRTLQVLLNGAAVNGAGVQAAPASNRGATVLASTLVQMSVGDYVEIAAWQDSGGSLATSSGTANTSTMCLWRISS
jgi:hypothetical protein